MSLVGWPFLVLLCVVAVAAMGGTAAVWERGGGGRAAVDWAARVGCLLLVMAMGGIVVLDQLNRTYSFYGTFSELVGHPPAAVAAGDRTPALPAELVARGDAAARRGAGVVVTRLLPGARSGIARVGYVYLPAAYFDRSRSALRFPVLELFHGYPGVPRNWISQLHLARVLDTEIAAGRMPPVIAVVPTDNDGVHDQECANAPGGPADETYLAVDVPADIVADYRAQSGPRGWAAAGYSTGGYCAVNLALHHPRQYAAAASMSGYFAQPGSVSRTLFRGLAGDVLANSPTWWVGRHPTGDPALYLLASGGDPQSVTAVRRFRAALPAGVRATAVLLRRGGHNYAVWSAAEPAVLDWLGDQVTGPIAAALRPGGAIVLPPPSRPSGATREAVSRESVDRTRPRTADAQWGARSDRPTA